MPPRIITDRYGNEYLQDEWGNVRPVRPPAAGEAVPAPHQRPGAVPGFTPYQFPPPAPPGRTLTFEEWLRAHPELAPPVPPAASAPFLPSLFGETLKPRETRPAGGPPTASPSEGSSGLETLAAMLMSLGNPAMATSYLKGREESRERARKRGAVSRVAGTVAKSRELEAAGDFPGAETALSEAFKDVEDPDVLKPLLTESGRLAKARGEAQGRERIAEAMTTLASKMAAAGGDNTFYSKLANSAFVFEMVAKSPELAPHAVGILTQLNAMGPKWQMNKDGTHLVAPDPNDPRKALEVPLTTVNQMGADALVRSLGGVPQETFQPPRREKVSVGEGREQVFPLPGQTTPVTPGPRGALPTTGTVQPAAGVLPVQTPLSAVKGLVDLPPPMGPRPTSEQAAILAKINLPTNLTWEELRQKYPNAGEVFEKARQRQKEDTAVAEAVARRKAMADEFYVIAFPQSAKVMFNKKTGVQMPEGRLRDVTGGLATLLDPESARAVATMNAMIPALERLEQVTRVVLKDAKPGTNLFNAVRLAIQRGLASSEDLAAFDALRGTLGLQIAVSIQGSRPSDTDAEAIQKGFPGDTDTVATGAARLRNLTRLLRDSRDARLGNPVSGVLRASEYGLAPSPLPTPGSPLPGGGNIQRSPLPTR